MIGERENETKKTTTYGLLNMRHYDIQGNDIDAFYDSDDDLVFVLDNTINSAKPNVLLVINPDGEKKWDDILSGKYAVDLETIRPKQDNKYQKLDIEYSGLSVYDTLIKAYNAGESLDDYLVQLDILRDSAARHSAITRLNLANEIIAKTNTTIVKTKESIVKLQERIKTLRAKLSATKKEIGRVSTKQSAAKILRLESQIDATNEKLKRAKKRLESAQRRLEIASVDAELASAVLNQPVKEIQHQKKSKAITVAPEYPVQKITSYTPEEDDDEDFDFDDDDLDEDDTPNTENDVKPLFDQDPNILDENIAFKPISFDAPVLSDTSINTSSENVSETPALNPISFEEPKISETVSEKPVLESITNISESELTDEFQAPVAEEPKPVLDTMRPVTQNIAQEISTYNESVQESEETPQPVPVFDVPEHIATQDMVQTPILNEQNSISETTTIQPRSPIVPPVAQPVTNTLNAPLNGIKENKKTSMIYYILLVALIVLSIFTLWLYQKNVANTAPMLTSQPQETQEAPKTVVQTQVKAEEPKTQETQQEPETISENEDDGFLDDKDDEVSEPETIAQEDTEIQVPETNDKAEPETDYDNEVSEYTEPEPISETTKTEIPEESDEDSPEIIHSVSEEEVIAIKPEYTAGSKHDDMFIQNNPVQARDEDIYYNDYQNDAFLDADDLSLDEEEAAYQAEQNNMY